MGDILQHDFKLALLADDLYEYTLTLCGKQVNDGKKTYRFPMFVYPNYVSRILDTTGDIHRNIIVANESRNPTERKRLQDDTMALCIYLNHLVRLAKNKGWISDRQLDTWRRKISATYWTTYNWKKSDTKGK